MVVARAGGSPEHECIADDLHFALGSYLRDAPYRAFRGIAVGIPPHNRYVYPDLSVACSPEYVTIHGIGVLVNPILVVEVLSKSTAELDLTSKRDGYASLESLKIYMVVSQNVARVEIFTRHANGILQTEAVITGLEATVSLPAINCEIRMADVYRGVNVAAEPDLGPDSFSADYPAGSNARISSQP